ncbi:MAG: head GIN domain-containing protein [Marinilabiliales bacterium]
MRAIIYFLTAMILSSCFHTLNPCIQGNGNYLSENRQINSFSEVHVNSDFNVFIVEDSLNSLRVTAEENILPYVKTVVKGNTLIVEKANNRCLRNNKPINIYISATGINDIKLSGSGFINFENITNNYINIDLSGSGDIVGNLTAGDLDVKISGSGEISLKGFCNNSNMKISGSGNIRSYNMEQNNCFADISGSGDIYVNVNDLLDVKITGSGSVHYIGQPIINTNITGSGNVYSSN